MTNTTSRRHPVLTPVDVSVSRPAEQRYRLEGSYRVGSELLQVILERDSYARQSFARVSVLAADRTWTVLATAPAHELAELPSPYADREIPDIEAVLVPVVRRLLDRASLILGL